MSSIVHRFKQEDPKAREAKEQSQAQGTSNLNYPVFKIAPLKLKEGKNYLRLLPQPTESPYESCIEALILQPWQHPKVQGGLVVDGTRGTIYSTIRQLLRQHPEFKYRIKNAEVKTGVDLGARPKAIFLAFDVQDATHTVKPLVLPGTLNFPLKDGSPRPPGAGTQIANFSSEKSFDGTKKYGSLFHPIEGRVICVEAVGAGTIQAKYIPSVERPLSLDSEKFAGVADQVASFDQFVNLNPSQEYQIAFWRDYLPADMWAYVATQMGFDPSPAPAPTPAKADVPLPDDDDVPYDVA